MLKAGFGKCEITPRVGVELYGFGPFLNRRSVGIRDILEARSAALSCGGHTVVIVSLDLCALHLPEIIAEIRRLIRRRHPELADCDIMINTSHTHSGPAVLARNTGWGVADPPWMAILPGRIAASVDQAIGNLEPVTVSQAMVPCRHMGLNRVYDRDAPPLDEVLKGDWEPAMPELTDTECQVIRCDDAAGALKGFLSLRTSPPLLPVSASPPPFFPPSLQVFSQTWPPF